MTTAMSEVGTNIPSPWALVIPELSNTETTWKVRPLKYRAERKSLSEFTPKITDRGLGNSKNWLNFCAIRKPSGKGGYGPIQSGLIVGDKEEGFGLIWEGSGKTVMIEDWDRVILTQKSSDGGTHHRHYTYRKI